MVVLNYQLLLSHRHSIFHFEIDRLLGELCELCAFVLLKCLHPACKIFSLAISLMPGLDVNDLCDVIGGQSSLVLLVTAYIVVLSPLRTGA